MFYYLQGPIAILEPNLAVVDCGGVGYACAVTAYTAAQLKLNQTARLYIHENIREDASDLFGFASREELRCFQLLLGTVAQGVGKKLAQRIILELRDKIGGAATELDFSGPVTAAPTGDSNVTLATAALQELGYSSAEIAAIAAARHTPIVCSVIGISPIGIDIHAHTVIIATNIAV